MKNIILFFGIVNCLSCTSQAIDKEYFDFVKGNYTLTQTGIEFLNREMSGYIKDPIFLGQDLEVRADGSIQLIITPAPNLKMQQLAQFQQIKNRTQAIYQLLGPNTYFSMSKIQPFLIATTNKEAIIGNVVFEHQVPIARVKSI